MTKVPSTLRAPAERRVSSDNATGEEVNCAALGMISRKWAAPASCYSSTRKGLLGSV